MFFPIVSSALFLLLLLLFMSVRVVHLIQSIRKKRQRPSRISANPNKCFRFLVPTRMVNPVNDILHWLSITDTEKNPQSISSTHRNKNDIMAAKTMIFLGSGGHTTEMIRLLQELDPVRYSPIMYVVADSDCTSIPRLREFIISSCRDSGNADNDCGNHLGDESDANAWRGRWPANNTGDENGNEEEKKCTPHCNDTLGAIAEAKNEPIMLHATNPNEKQATSNTKSTIHTNLGTGEAPVYILPRARDVNQSYVTSVFTTIRSFIQTLLLIWKTRPELLLCNGPGTCVPLIYSAFLFRVLGLFRCNSNCGYNTDCKVVFVESLCRVETLSLTGKLVYHLVDRFVVHWPLLKKRYPMVEICDVFVNHEDYLRNID
mmetsp:Transcript_30586/g.61130  ORF Transcript_30586/g.61130 Transcript_30586/m.61130 type:complete len:374 (+) Transcript_30586:64-1185(+)